MSDAKAAPPERRSQRLAFAGTLLQGDRVNPRADAHLRAGTHWAQHYGDAYQLQVWFDTAQNVYRAEVWTRYKFQETLEHADVYALIDMAQDSWGDE